ncbi:unnamed protein product [Sphenostylis stenocarpa]|uniref:alpha-1,2-Mannosidase n=1 Tax=Sphenostylis stenocarpa TaxID=92480 RepID=A0AA86SLL2_9FABA|nr:unnamed protein product [Sphenostylis stenocarpa]
MSQSQPPWATKKKRMKEKVRNIRGKEGGRNFHKFYHAYDNYMTYAFPHDELKPLSKTFTNSLSELGNLKLEHLPQDYNGSALTLIESLSSLVIMGNNTEFERAVLWLSENLTFDVDARINLFECNIRVLGGLVSAHLLASDSSKKLFRGAYKNQLLVLAEDLGKRFLPAFNTATGLPYAWINLKLVFSCPPQLLSLDIALPLSCEQAELFIGFIHFEGRGQPHLVIKFLSPHIDLSSVFSSTTIHCVLVPPLQEAV